MTNTPDKNEGAGGYSKGYGVKPCTLVFSGQAYPATYQQLCEDVLNQCAAAMAIPLYLLRYDSAHLIHFYGNTPQKRGEQ